MSYDLMVFEPASAPADHDEFMTWYRAQTEWAEDHAYNDPKVSTPRLSAFFHEIIKQYPAMNGPYGVEELDDEDEDDALVSDYTVGQSVIYIAFAWSKAEGAYPEVLRLATKHQIGFFDVSSNNEEVWLPDGKGGLAIVHKA
ncbi:hypothetical protein FXN63_24710 [Pigmentiphaga aceris]|uniref:Uncharacterized protein n=1 Tax=Pigmentiphaga aceris TaxID=1940612 RepID=A0A5C0B1L1_9BURK|nr:hypothetical protein [Pigmentiphaga aceris]QEI08689.1 hypothetical protein FXN63_24710 [Pigmentiphaga aceris]